MARGDVNEYRDLRHELLMANMRQDANEKLKYGHPGGLASVVDRFSRGFRMKADENKRAAAGRSLSKALTSKPWRDPNTAITAEDIADVPGAEPVPAEIAPGQLPQGLQRASDVLAAEYAQNPDNQYMGRDLRGLLTKNLERQTALGDRDEGREYAENLRGTIRDEGIAAATTAHNRELAIKEMERRLKLTDEKNKFERANTARLTAADLKARRGEWFKSKQAHDKPYLAAGVKPPAYPKFDPQATAPGAAPAAASPVVQGAGADPNLDPQIQAALAAEEAAKAGTPQDQLRAAQAAKVEAESQARETGKLRSEAKFNLPQVRADATYMLRLLDQIVSPELAPGGKAFARGPDGRLVPGKEHVGLRSMVGAKNVWSGALPAMLPFREDAYPGSDAADFQTLMKQVKGKQFLQAFETLKGGGQITEVEGTKATEAMARMSTAQSEVEFRKGVLEFRDEVQKLVRIAHEKAQVEATLGPGWTKVKP
jgi:hypothetical protein|tara:strand:- start:3499 stop:4950 length:1452 start_codon:yes stop_codon:yes gene_type:complete